MKRLDDIKDIENIQIELNSYWQRIAQGDQELTPQDLAHVNSCLQCQSTFLLLVSSQQLKITEEMMHSLTDKGLKQSVIKAICIRAVASSTGN